MHIVLFIIYGAFCCYALTRIPFFRRSGIRPSILIGFFILRVLAGVVHNWVAWRFYPGHGDIWLFFRESFTTKHELLTNFSAFIADNSALADLPHNFIECIHIIFNIASFDNMYINTLFFIFCTFGGQVALFLVIYRRLHNDMLSAGIALLLPSILFWTSCMHTEGLVYCLLGWLVWYMDRMVEKGVSASRVLFCLLLTAAVIVFRPVLAVGLIPALAGWILTQQGFTRRQWRVLLPALTAALIGTCLLFPAIPSRILHILSARAAEFQTLTGGSRICLPALQPTADSFWHVLPTALFNGFLQPTPGSGGQAIYLAFSGELGLIWLLILMGSFAFIRTCLQFRRQKAPPDVLSGHPQKIAAASLSFTCFCLLLAVPCILLIGYIVPFVGAIIRYRSILLPFILLPFSHQLQQYRIPARWNTWLQHRIFIL